MKLGIRSGALGLLSLSETARLIASEGFDGVQLDLRFSDTPRLMPGISKRGLTDALCALVHSTFQNEGLEIFAVSAYVDLLEANPRKRRQNTEFVKSLLRCGSALGSRTIVTDPGSCEVEADSQSEECWLTLLHVVSDMLVVAEEENALLTLRPLRGQTLNTAARAKKFLEQIGSPYLKLAIDPAGLLRPESLDEMFALMVPNLVMGLARDIVFDGNDIQYSYPGAGALDYPRYLRLMSKHLPGAPLIMEEVDPETFREARDFIRRIVAGIENETATFQTEANQSCTTYPLF